MSTAEALALATRIGGGLAVVLVAVAVSARIARRARPRGIGMLRVVERVGLSRDTFVAVVEAHGRTLLIGVSPQGVSLLAPLDGLTKQPPSGISFPAAGWRTGWRW